MDAIQRPLGEDSDRDLGFGAVVAGRSRRRLLNPDGTFNVVRRGLGWRQSLALYFRLLSMSWPRFLALVAVAYLAQNAAFALLYTWAGPGALTHLPPGLGAFERWAQAFFFSVQTISTVGYGGMAPATTAANLIMTAESVVGLLTVALVTGLVFARFSRPIAAIVYSSRAVVAPYLDGQGLMLRIANRRPNQIVNLTARLIFALRDSDRAASRRFHELRLERDQVSFFPLSWTIVHPIDAGSPLAGLNADDLAAGDAEVLVLLTGFDETFSQTVHSRSSYSAAEIVWGARFASAFGLEHRDGRLHVDVRKIHDLEPAG